MESFAEHKRQEIGYTLILLITFVRRTTSEVCDIGWLEQPR